MVLKKLKSLFAGTPNNPRVLTAPQNAGETILAPDRPFCAIGDVHGRIDLLDPLYRRIRAEYGADIPVIFLGDNVDRGPDTASVLEMIHDLARTDPSANISLMGNHETMMLEFIDDPAGQGARWLTFGGVETLQSYGIAVPARRPDAEDAMEAADRLESAMSAGLQDWLRGLPAVWSTGNVHCVHAAMDPAVPPDRQKPRVMINGHPEFLTRARSDGATVVHGHTVMAEAAIWEGRISLDTGAYYSGRLSAAHIDRDTCTFLS
ncbi:metallophosphoesterase [Pseudooceanicola batsensis]|nr:metallophosphoesterase [Pseudooceanicola batsensis]